MNYPLDSDPKDHYVMSVLTVAHTIVGFKIPVYKPIRKINTFTKMSGDSGQRFLSFNENIDRYHLAFTFALLDFPIAITHSCLKTDKLEL